jgi:predicted TIM-barrel fold metal-dependent hydrolase
MVIGGVFERHPRLRMGIIECGAQWLGPLVERMELLWDYYPTTKAALPRRPMDYVVDHVRVTPFFIEPVDVWIDRWPRLADVYCFSSDYPHIEGGVNPVTIFGDRLQRHGEEVMEKFFRTNGQLLMPDVSVPAG